MHISSETVHIVVAESSVIVRSGVVAALDRLQNINAHIIEITSTETLEECMRMHSPDVLIVNPLFCGKFSLPAMRRKYPGVKYIALATSFISDSVLEEYNGSISIFDTLDKIAVLFERLLSDCNDADTSAVSDNLYPDRSYSGISGGSQDIYIREHSGRNSLEPQSDISLEMEGQERDGSASEDVLSQREKEIVVGVVRGLTNKEIADELFLSVHTVITHRRNISRKLQIHSAAGLTIYAIANKLIELKDLK